MKKITALALFVFATVLAPLTLVGCNTVEGMGEDLQETSENTKEAISNDK